MIVRACAKSVVIALAMIALINPGTVEAGYSSYWSGSVASGEWKSSSNGSTNGGYNKAGTFCLACPLFVEGRKTAAGRNITLASASGTNEVYVSYPTASLSWTRCRWGPFGGSAGYGDLNIQCARRT